MILIIIFAARQDKTCLEAFCLVLKVIKKVVKINKMKTRHDVVRFEK